MKGWSDRSPSYRMRWPISNFIIFLVVKVQHFAKICYLLNSAIWTKFLYFACQAIVRNQKGSKLLYTHFVFPLHFLPCKYCNPLGYFMLNVGIFGANLDFPNISKYYLYENAYEPLSKKSWTPAYHFLSSFYVWTPSTTDLVIKKFRRSKSCIFAIDLISIHFKQLSHIVLHLGFSYSNLP